MIFSLSYKPHENMRKAADQSNISMCIGVAAASLNLACTMNIFLYKQYVAFMEYSSISRDLTTSS